MRLFQTVYYGFDHALGPWVELQDNDGPHIVEEASYRFNTDFDCHALAHYLRMHAAGGYIDLTPRLALHIMVLDLDLPV